MRPWSWLKREWRYFFTAHALIVVTLVLGTAGLFLIGKLKASFLLSIQRQERELLSSDFSLGIRRPLEAQEIELFKRKAQGEILGEYQLVDMSSMLYVPSKEVSRLVEVRVLPVGFPFYGVLAAQSGPMRLTADHPLFTDNCVYLSAEIQRLLEITPVDTLMLGEGRFKSCGVINSDVTQGFRGFSLAPRVYIGANQVAATKLLGLGSIAYYSYHLKLTESGQAQAQSWKQELAREFKDSALQARTPKEASEQMARSGEILGDYLQLASLVALLLAVVGCFYLFRSLLHRRLKDIAVLRALGASPWQLRPLLLLPLLLDFLLSLPLALVLAELVYPLLTLVLGELFGAQFPQAPFPREWLYQTPMILLVVLCGLGPALEEALRVPVRVLLQDQEQVPVLPWRSYWVFLLAGLAAFTGLAMLIARSFKTGAFFTAGILVAVIVLLLAAGLARWLLQLILRRVSLHRPFGLGAGLVLRRLIRRPVPTLLTILALGLGGTLVSMLAHLEMSLGKEFALGQSTRPSLFMFDIQDDQREALQRFLDQRNTPTLAFSPMVRGAITEVNGAPFKKADSDTGFRTREQETESRFRNRMMNMTWAQTLNSSETLIEGLSFADATVPVGEHAISLEQRFAQRLGLGLDDRITFEVLGVPIVGRVVNIRTVKWTSFLPNFFIVFAPGALEEAPKSWLAAVPSLPKQQVTELQNRVAREFPNVSAVDVGQLVGRLMELFSRLQQALILMAWFAFFVGVVVVVAIAQDQILRREHEVMLEKTLGLSPLKVVLMALGEFILLASLALSIGGVAGASLAGILTIEVFQGSPVWGIDFIILQVLLGTSLATLPLLLAAKRIFRLRPAGLLQGP